MSRASALSGRLFPSLQRHFGESAARPKVFISKINETSTVEAQ